MEFHQFRERCHEVQSTLISEIRTENSDSYKGETIIEPALESQEDDLLQESFQNVVADESMDIGEIKIETDANAELTTFPDTNKHTNGTQTAVVQIEDDANNHQSLECDICHKILGSTARLKCHIRVVHGPKKFDCVPCGVSFTERKHYDVHLQTKWHIKKMQDLGVKDETIPKKEFQCDICPASFSTKAQLENHYCRSHKPRQFTCPYCQKKYVSNHDMRRHIANAHTSGDERPFECDICQKTFKVKSHIYEHKTRVHGPKLHRCDVCGSSFSTSSNLARHMATHNRIK
ncbi:zinc finger protein 691 [Aedes albopictus]|uniref:C2H2-type domain-containing protein n=1 Tax=Aedes albopictus TaxID=7160 RepID=A0ABM1ZQ52_AEDAL